MILIGDIQHGALIAAAACTGYDIDRDVCFSRLDSNRRFLGGFILTDYTGSMMMNHMAGVGGHWCSPELLWAIFDYQFNQLSVKKAMCTVPSFHTRSRDLVERAGFKHEYSIEDGVPNGSLDLFSMLREDCKWLRLRDRYMRVNGNLRGEHVHA